MHSALRSVSRIAAGLFLATLSSAGARGDLITPTEANIIVQSTLADGDFALLNAFYGLGLGQSVAYHSTIDFGASSWSGTLTGTFQGLAVDVAYTGSFAAYPGGPFTWNSSGTYGINAWTGSGSVAFANAPGGLNVTYHTALGVGSNSGTIDITTLALVSSDSIDLLDSNSSGQAVVNGVHIPGLKSLHLVRKFPPKWVSDIKIDDVTLNNDGSFLGDTDDITQEVTAVPEPSSLTLMGIAGTIGLGAFRRQRKARCCAAGGG